MIMVCFFNFKIAYEVYFLITFKYLKYAYKEISFSRAIISKQSHCFLQITPQKLLLHLIGWIFFFLQLTTWKLLSYI